jgi:hypothetical protein
VLQQLRVFDVNRSSTPKAKKTKPKSKKSTSKKSNWKTEWHKSVPYQRWQAAMVPEARKPKIDSAEGQEFLALRQDAFRVRDAIKAKWKDETEAKEASVAESAANAPAQAVPAQEAEARAENEVGEPGDAATDEIANEVVSSAAIGSHNRTLKLKSVNANRTRKKGSKRNPAGRKLVIRDDEQESKGGVGQADKEDKESHGDSESPKGK